MIGSDVVESCVLMERFDDVSLIPFEICEPGAPNVGTRKDGSLMWEIGEWNFVFVCLFDMVDFVLVLSGKFLRANILRFRIRVH